MKFDSSQCYFDFLKYFGYNVLTPDHKHATDCRYYPPFWMRFWGNHLNLGHLCWWRRRWTLCQCLIHVDLHRRYTFMQKWWCFMADICNSRAYPHETKTVRELNAFPFSKYELKLYCFAEKMFKSGDNVWKKLWIFCALGQHTSLTCKKNVKY